MLNQRGFTILELMVVVGVSAMMAYAMFLAIQTGSNHLEITDLRMTIQDSAREGLYKMVQEIRESAPSRVTIAAGCTSITFNVPDPNNPVLGTYAVNWPGHQIQYSYDAALKRVTRTNATLSTTSTVANDVSSVMFTSDTTSPFTCSAGVSPAVVTVVLNVQRALKNGRNVPAVPLLIAGEARPRNT